MTIQQMVRALMEPGQADHDFWYKAIQRMTMLSGKEWMEANAYCRDQYNTNLVSEV